MTPAEPTVPVERFSAVFERGGGFSPMPQKLVIRPGRRATATVVGTRGRLHTVHFRISVLTAKRLRNGLAQPKFDSHESDPDPGGCANCFQYTLEFKGKSISFWQNKTPPWISKTVQRFEALIEAHRPFH